MTSTEFTEPTWPDDADKVSGLIPTLPPTGNVVGPALRIGTHDHRGILTGGEPRLASVRIGTTRCALNAAGIDALIAALTAARAIIVED